MKLRLITGYDRYEREEFDRLKDDFEEVPDITSKEFGLMCIYLDTYINSHPNERDQVIKDIDDYFNGRAKFIDPVYCAECGDEIEESYYMIGDNFLQIKYFDDPEGKDNIFCSEECLLEHLSVTSVDVVEEPSEQLF